MHLIDRYRGALLGLAVGDTLRTTLEDTETTPKELAATFGAAIRDLVREVTDDKRLPTAERKGRPAAGAPRLSDRTKRIPIADKVANVRDVTHHRSSSPRRPRSAGRPASPRAGRMTGGRPPLRPS